MKDSPKRLRFDHVESQTTESGTDLVKVTLAFGDTVVQQSEALADETLAVLKAAAKATLAAVTKVAARHFACDLVDLDHVNALGKNLIAVLVDINYDGKVTQVFGSCQVNGQELAAAVKAALNATNRFFELAMRR